MFYDIPFVNGSLTEVNEGGILDIVKDGENGLIAERRNAESLSDCIQRLLDNPELRKQMGENGRKKFHDHFTNDIFERTMVEILGCVCK